MIQAVFIGGGRIFLLDKVGRATSLDAVTGRCILITNEEKLWVLDESEVKMYWHDMTAPVEGSHIVFPSSMYADLRGHIRDVRPVRKVEDLGKGELRVWL